MEPLPYIGPIAFDNVSGDIPRGHWGFSTFTIPGVNGTGVCVEGQRFTDQVFTCTAFCVDQTSVTLLKHMIEAIQLTVVEIKNSLGEVWENCLVLNAEIPPGATVGCLAYNVPNGDGTVRLRCRRLVTVQIIVRFQYDV